MAKINIQNVREGFKLKSLDQEDQRWYLTEVIAFNTESVTLKDIDHKSDFQGMVWTDLLMNLEDETQYKEL